MKIIPYLVNKYSVIAQARNFYYQKFKGTIPVSYDPLDSDFLRQLLAKENPVILEIGCHNGSHTLWFLETFHNPTIHCFEPDPRAIKQFKQKLGDHPAIKLFEGAISDQTGIQTFFQSDGINSDWTCSGSLRKPTNHNEVHPQIIFEKTIEIPVETLDTYCQKNGLAQIDFIWMDVQGAEMNVFKGGKNTLNNVHFLYTEYSNVELYQGQANLKVMSAQLAESGFKLIRRYHGDALYQNILLTNSKYPQIKK
ncbi:FkbM family methyltransferase [Synechocystis salina LEGE 06099]|uniref:FkbM family methyltransferase n=1 Tax=Synechocystis salina TaxID=945780 RepID=UPI0018815DDF|nr:FkbM family methyltransferase [Synechocystis salina]MBE9203863.1 FkbM family methyltransferase [Synechocystis salina LEGE 06099]